MASHLPRDVWRWREDGLRRPGGALASRPVRTCKGGQAPPSGTPPPSGTFGALPAHRSASREQPVTTVWAYVTGDAEVMGDAADLAEELGAAAAGIAAGADPQALAAAGAERVLVLHAPYDAQVHAAAIAGAVAEPRAVLLPGTADGADLAPRLAALLGAACLLDCAWLRAGTGGLLAGRWAHDDRAQERWLVPEGLPLVATVRPGARGAARPRPRPADVTVLQAGEPRVRRLRRLHPDPRSVRLGEAERIVAAGLGI